MKKIYSYLFLLCLILYNSIGLLNLNAKKISVEYALDSQIKTDNEKLIQDFFKKIYQYIGIGIIEIKNLLKNVGLY